MLHCFLVSWFIDSENIVHHAHEQQWYLPVICINFFLSNLHIENTNDARFNLARKFYIYFISMRVLELKAVVVFSTANDIEAFIARIFLNESDYLIVHVSQLSFLWASISRYVNDKFLISIPEEKTVIFWRHLKLESARRFGLEVNLKWLKSVFANLLSSVL